MIKVKALTNINENGRYYNIDDIFEIDEKRAKGLGNIIEIIKENIEIKKDVENSPVNRMISKVKKKKGK